MEAEEDEDEDEEDEDEDEDEDEEEDEEDEEDSVDSVGLAFFFGGTPRRKMRSRPWTLEPEMTQLRTAWVKMTPPTRPRFSPPRRIVVLSSRDVVCFEPVVPASVPPPVAAAAAVAAAVVAAAAAAAKVGVGVAAAARFIA